jgi:hypothetical protein
MPTEVGIHPPAKAHRMDSSGRWNDDGSRSEVKTIPIMPTSGKDDFRHSNVSWNP